VGRQKAGAARSVPRGRQNVYSEKVPYTKPGGRQTNNATAQEATVVLHASTLTEDRHQVNSLGGPGSK